MAVTSHASTSAELLDPARCKPVALIAAATLIAAAGFATGIVLQAGGLEGLLAPAMLFAAVWLFSAGATVQLVRGRLWAQRYLLGVSLAIAVAGLTWLFHAMLYGRQVAVFSPTLLVGGGVVVLSGVLAWRLTAATLPGTRLRYGSMVAVSAAAAVGVLLAVNMIAQADYWRANAEVIGRFGLSERTKRVIDGLGQDVTLTAVYTSVDPDSDAEKYRPRLIELLEEMRERSERIEVVNITSDAGKARLIARLRQQAETGGPHAFVQSFVENADQLIAEMRSQRDRWKAWQEGGYLDLWALPTELQRVFAQLAGEIERLHTNVRGQMEGGNLPDYAALTGDITETVDALQQSVKALETLMDQVAAIPPAVRDNAPSAMEHVRQATRAFEQVDELAGEPGDDPPDDPAATLEKMVEHLGQAVASANKAADALQLIAGDQRTRLVTQSDVWYLGQFPLHLFYATFAQETGQIRSQLQAAVDRETPEAQAGTIAQARPVLSQFAGQFQLAQQTAERAVNALSEVDDPSAKLLQAARDGEVFGQLADRLAPFAEAAEGLEPAEESTLARDLAQENVVLVEVDGTIEVIPFDQVWRQPQRNNPAAPPDSDAPRVFHGDAAIGARILKMTRQPFGTIYLAYAAPPRQQNMFMQPPPNPKEMYTTLRGRLTQANFEVVDWDLSGPMPEPNAPETDDPNSAPLPRAVLVLPPPGGMTGRYTDEHVSRIRQAVDDQGTPAMVLTYAQPNPFGPPPDALLGEWLTEQWGIEPDSGHLVLPCVPDTEKPGRYRIDLLRFNHLPLSTFSDHRVGAPLQGQRMLWSLLCPVQIGQVPEGVTAEPLLSVPAGWNDTWATARVEQIRAALDTRGSYVRPDVEAGDITAPFPVAVAASRSQQADPNAAPARLIVAGVGAGLTDGYIDGRILRLRPDGGTYTADPPIGNADLVINGMYWLTGADAYIASGPARGTPVRLISESGQRFLWLLCVVVLPLAVVGIGGVVMLWRRR
jgi:hypothetical protein